MNSDEAASSQEAESLPYRRVDPTQTEWRSVGTYSGLAAWHANKAVLERNGVVARMGANPYDDNLSDLLVPITDFFWAAELLRKEGEPKIERSLGFPLVSQPPPLPARVDHAVSSAPAKSAVSDAAPVLSFDPDSKSGNAAPQYGCILAVLWTLLALIILILLVMLATYQPT